MYISFVNTCVTPGNNDLGPYIVSKTFELCMSVSKFAHKLVLPIIPVGIENGLYPI